MIELKINTDNFKKFLKQKSADVRKAIDEGLIKAGWSLMRDAIMERPTVPLKEGFLRGSGSVIVNSKLVADSSDFSTKKGTPGTMMTERYEVVVGFNTPYAARLHEHPEYKFTEPSAGGKFLESKMIKNKDLYISEIAQFIKKAL